MQKVYRYFPHNVLYVPNIGGYGFGMTSANLGTDSPTPGVSTHLLAHEVADVLRVSTIRVGRLCQSGELRATKPGKFWLIHPADLQAYLDAHSNRQAEEAS